MNPDIYQKLLDDEGFINDCWNSHDVSDKIEILQKAGWNLDVEWLKNHKIEKLSVEEEMDDDSDQELLQRP